MPSAKRMRFTLLAPVANSPVVFRFYFPGGRSNVDRVLGGSVIRLQTMRSYLDPHWWARGFIGTLIYLAREILFRFPVVGWMLLNWNSFRWNRESGARGTKAILDQLSKGGAIILFPERTRSLDGKLQPARSGSV